MPTKRSPRYGSLQYWPRKRASKFLPSVNWDAISSDSKTLKGFIGYKAGMMTAIVKDNTPNSMTKGKRIAIPVTIIECPNMKILSVRFYKNGMVFREIQGKNPEKELRKKIKPQKKESTGIESIKQGDYDDIRIVVYSLAKKTGIKKIPDISEIGLRGTIEEKLNFAKEHLAKEISVEEVFEKGKLVDIRGLTKGKGLQGPVKRWGIGLKSHKSEKGQRAPGSLGPWHPSRVTFRAPQAGQMGMFTRVVYNNSIIDINKSGNENIKGLKNFGDIRTGYIAVYGSVQGSAKRQLLITAPLRTTKKQVKKNYEFMELK